MAKAWDKAYRPVPEILLLFHCHNKQRWQVICIWPSCCGFCVLSTVQEKSKLSRLRLGQTANKSFIFIWAGWPLPNSAIPHPMNTRLALCYICHCPDLIYLCSMVLSLSHHLFVCPDKSFFFFSFFNIFPALSLFVCHLSFKKWHWREV